MPPSFHIPSPALLLTGWVTWAHQPTPQAGTDTSNPQLQGSQSRCRSSESVGCVQRPLPAAKSKAVEQWGLWPPGEEGGDAGKTDTRRGWAEGQQDSCALTVNPGAKYQLTFLVYSSTACGFTQPTRQGPHGTAATSSQWETKMVADLRELSSPSPREGLILNME